MKKLISVLAVLALVCGAAFADVSDVDIMHWYPLNSNSNISVTAYEPAGFDFELPEGAPSEGFEFYSMYPIDWLYNSNEPFTVTLAGLGDGDITASADDSLNVYLDFGSRYLFYSVPWAGNGTYTFTAEDILSEISYPPSDETEVSYVDIYVGDPQGSELAQLKPGASGRVSFFVVPEEETPETELPEPGVCAYGAMGLVSLIGMKKRFVK
ncbi:MAG: hypothetical protein J6U98_02990 [Abditibacteriota bacterium]|nr:hypothetical protein [Abditibacteriota bacterium]MBP5718592.1 hypothetical protein [Abditibacteriota bacterium]